MIAVFRTTFHAFITLLLGSGLGMGGCTAAWAAAGQVQFVAGDVLLERGSSSREVMRGAEVEVGDVLRSGPSGQAQIRFTDGGILALYPQSQLAIGAYSDSAQTGQSEDRFAVRFLQGALRAVTGKIGQRNPQNYRVITPTAVVGIRGTAFKVFMNAEGEVEVSGEHNTIEVCTEAGCVEVKPREAVRVISAQQLPVYTHTRALLPQTLPREAVQPGEQILSDGSYGAVILVPTTPPAEPVPQQPDPVVPTDPGGGRQPTNPTTPGTPVVPTNPGGGRQPGNPATPTNPTAPTTPPIVPVRPIRPIIPIGPIIIVPLFPIR
ncbi:FecR family protein [Simplicispira lacusdiani]|uniref:FecR family protein n=1 Tax=Simplicispira lacusdiani TaxID=2213010 RepID=UPI000E74B756|nr:FecR family protein [Simplicispira lacusdiani]